jgi:DNA-binding CsgD family transcriptional regulator
MNTLSPAEWRVAEEYCKGLADKEVADNLCRSIWTTKSQKKTIYKKLGISNSTELLLYMICEKTKRDFDLKEIRKHGIEVLFSMLFIVMQVTCHNVEMRRTRGKLQARTSLRGSFRGGGKRNNDFDLTTLI